MYFIYFDILVFSISVCFHLLPSIYVCLCVMFFVHYFSVLCRFVCECVFLSSLVEGMCVFILLLLLLRVCAYVISS